MIYSLPWPEIPFKRTQVDRVVQVLTGRCNLQRLKKTSGRAEFSLCLNSSLEDETPNHHAGNCKHYHLNHFSQCGNKMQH